MLTLIRGSYEGRSLPEDDFPGRFFACWMEDELAEALQEAGFGEVAVEVRPWRQGESDGPGPGPGLTAGVDNRQDRPSHGPRGARGVAKYMDVI